MNGSPVPPPLEPLPPEVPSVLLGRQPILDRAGALVAYELLFRDSAQARSALVKDARAATEEVILNTVAQFGLARALGSRRGFVNVARDCLGAEGLGLLEPARFTIEIAGEPAGGADAPIDAALEAACRRLRQAGFEIALDGVRSLAQIPARVLGLVDIIKLDLRGASAPELPGLIARAHDAGCTVLATKVETQEEYRWLRDRGADLFQGYFFARPELLRQNHLGASQAALLKLHHALAGEPSLGELQAEVKRNPVLLAQLMKFAGSALSAGRHDLTVGEAIARIGTRRLARLAQLLLFAGSGHLALQDDPLVQLVHTRARFMELLAQELWPHDEVLADAAFQAGIFSLMHVVTLQPSEQLLAQVATSERIRRAVLHAQGDLGDLLCIAGFMEGFTSVRPTPALMRHDVSSHRLSSLFAQATSEILSSE